jgi:hypothetical protein
MYEAITDASTCPKCMSTTVQYHINSLISPLIIMCILETSHMLISAVGPFPWWITYTVMPQKRRKPSSLVSTSVTIHNHAYQKLFPFITCPHSLLPLPILHLQETYLCNQHVVKLHHPNSFPHPRPIIWYDVKLHVLNPSQLDHLLLGTPLSLVPHRVHRRHQRYATQGHMPCPTDVPM